jgi:HEAT repeat protein
MAAPARRTDPRKPSFDDVLARLKSNNKPSAAEIAALSLPFPEDALKFKYLWPSLGADARASLLGRMLELAEDDATLDFTALYRIILDDASAPLRAAALGGLADTEDITLMRKLIRIMQSDPEASVRAAAAESLGRFVLLAEHGRLGEGSANSLAGALLGVHGDDAEEIEVRRRALEAMAYLSRHDVRQAITDAYDSGDPLLRASAMFAAGRNLDPSWLDTLLDEMDSDLPEMRYEAAVASGEYQDERAVPGLVRLTEDHDAEVRLAAVTALGKIGGQQARERLEELTAAEDEAVRVMAAQALDDMTEDTDSLIANIGEAEDESDFFLKALSQIDEEWNEETHAG